VQSSDGRARQRAKAHPSWRDYTDCTDRPAWPTHRGTAPRTSITPVGRLTTAPPTLP